MSDSQFKLGLAFDDVLLEPRYSEIESRFSGDIDLSSLMGNYLIKFPIISANMDTTTEYELALKMQELGGLGIIHRFMTPEKQYSMLSGLCPAVGCIGTGLEEQKRWLYIKPVSHMVLIDVAHGHHKSVIDQIRWVREGSPEICIIAGNVATEDGAYDLVEAGANIIKNGVGPGSVCDTRRQTGCGVPQLSAIIDVCKIKKYRPEIKIIADGGIRFAGDCIKAIAAGADFVMIGNLFAGTTEAVGKIYRENNFVYKIYRGLSSRESQLSWKGFAKSIEGELTRVPYKGPVKEIFDDLIASMLSGMSYQNALNLAQLRENAVFIRQTSAGLIESSPHALRSR